MYHAQQFQSFGQNLAILYNLLKRLIFHAQMTHLFSLLQMAFPKLNPLIHFGVCNATRSSPAAKFFTPHNVESELRYAAREFFQRDDAMQVDLSKRIVYLNRTIKW